MLARLLALVSLLSALPVRGQERTLSFNRDIRPILSENCYFCHGFDPSHREADLRLDTFEGAIAEKAIVPGKPEESEVIKRIYSTDPDEIMPVPKSHRTLTTAQKETLKTWIAQGAKYEPHWAFIPPPDKVPVPAVKDAAWPRSDLDRFVLARMEQENLTPAPEASRGRWLRRVTLDLTGLPPNQPELDAFLADLSGTAYETVVDRLLASSRFGERMAVPWLDLARYADSFGYQSDVDTKAWPYRDWVIRALNENLPWDQFITWQIAGDLLPNPTQDQRLATAFNRLHRKTNEGGSIEEEMRQEGVSDRVHTFGTTFLGLTFECCRCHDHKYDPITARDYYSLGAFFNSIEEAGVMQYATNILPQPALLLTTPEQEKTVSGLKDRIRQEEENLRGFPDRHEGSFQQWLLSGGKTDMPDQVGFYSLDESNDGKLTNAVDASAAANAGGNPSADGKLGKALQLNGDDALALPPLGIQHAYQPMSFSFWLKPGEAWPRAVVLSNTSSADTNYSGYELVLESGILNWTVMREFPGNAISVRATEAVPVAGWSYLTVTYDGSMRAHGLKIFLNGRPALTKVIKDSLRRDYQIGSALNFGARSRDFGMRGGLLDEIRIFRRAVTEAEAAQLHDGKTLEELLKKADREPEETKLLRDYYFAAVDGPARLQNRRLLEAREALNNMLSEIPEIPVMEEAGSPRPTFILNRGAYDAPGEPVARAVPGALPSLPAGAATNRLGLAQWLTQPDHPLTARVLVNRIWQEFLGQGILATSDNFGTQGALPSHPELLDWLARNFINGKWDHKAVCKQIVLSATYCQDSRASTALRERDPANALLARGPARRLTAEMLRDSALALGGLLQAEIGGPPAMPWQAEGSMWKSLNNFLPDYVADQGAGLHRRSLYTFWRRTTTPPNMMAFDAASRDVCAARRTPTNTPLQPLVLMNDPQFVEAARALGGRMLKEGGATIDNRLKWLFREVSGRFPSESERRLVEELYAEQLRLFQAQPAQAEALLEVGSPANNAGQPATELAAATTTASALFNLDVSVMQR